MKSYGYIETYGYVASIVAADIALKTADVKLTNLYFVKGGIVTIEFNGDVSAVTSAVDAGVEEAKKLGKYLSSNVIARPDNGLKSIVEKEVKTTSDKKNDEELANNIISDNIIVEEVDEPEKKIDETEYESLNVGISETVEQLNSEEIEEIIEDVINETFDVIDGNEDKEDYSKMLVIELKQKVNKLGKYKWNEIKSMKKNELIDILKNEK